jgi:hypothetical protein
MVTGTEALVHKLEERVRELERLASVLVERADTVRREIDALAATVEGLRDLATKVAVLENQQRGREKRVDRYWLVIAAGVGAIVGSLLTLRLSRP